MQVVHITTGPIWNGDRTEMMVGIATYRLMQNGTPANPQGNGKPHNGMIKIYFDNKVIDKNAPPAQFPDPPKRVLMFRDPFVIKCADALKFPARNLMDYNRTELHYIPLSALTRYQDKRKRTMSQADFEFLKAAGLTVKKDIIDAKQ